MSQFFTAVDGHRLAHSENGVLQCGMPIIIRDLKGPINKSMPLPPPLSAFKTNEFCGAVYGPYESDLEAVVEVGVSKGRAGSRVV